MKHKLEITLTERQGDLLMALIDSFVEGRAMGGGNGREATGELSGAYRAHDRFCETLLDKLGRERTRIAGLKRIDEQLARVRRALRGE